MLRVTNILLTMLVAAFVTSCAGMGGAPEASTIDGIRVAPVVKITDKVYYNGPENNWGFAIGGLIGAAIASQAISEPERIKLYMESEHIDLPAIVRNQYLEALQRSPQFAGKIRDDAKNQIELEIQMYGIAQKGAFSSQYKPVLRVKARLYNAEGKVVWEKVDFVANLNGTTPGYAYKELFEAKGAMENAFTVAAHETVQSLVPSP